MKRIFILAFAALVISGCTVIHEDESHGHYQLTPPPWFFSDHHVTHTHSGHHRVHHHYTNEYGWKSHRPYYNPCNC